jgi:F-type H+-transporting ATPase subunit a
MIESRLTRNRNFFCFLSFVLFLGFFSIGSASAATESSESAAFDPKELIMHHVADAHEFHILGEGDRSVSLPLPIILWTDQGLVTFLSSEFHHDDQGKHVVEKNGVKLLKYHEKIYYADENGALQLDSEGHPLNAKPWDFSITKNVFSLFLSAILLLLIFIPVASSYKRNQGIPRGLSGFMEPLVVYVRDEIARPNIGEKKYLKYMPYLLTAFFFIWINNLIGLIPFFPFSANLTGNIAFTLTLAMFTAVITNFSGTKSYWGHIFKPAVPSWLYIIMIPVELIGVISKPFALMIRLFANITAGHIIILSLISLIFIFKTILIAPVSIGFVLFINTIELLVAALQAFIFTLLSALFIGMAVEEHDEHH